MPPHVFTVEQDKQLLAAIATIPGAKLAAAMVFLLIKDMPNRVQFIQYLKTL